jgi:hypothetical protein
MPIFIVGKPIGLFLTTIKRSGSIRQTAIHMRCVEMPGSRRETTIAHGTITTGQFKLTPRMLMHLAAVVFPPRDSALTMTRSPTTMKLSGSIRATSLRIVTATRLEKSAAWWGKIVLDLMGVGVLALVFAAFRAYRSPSAFSHSVARRFRLMPEGSLVFYPRPNSVGYIVPDASTEQALRTFARGSSALSLVAGIFVIGFGLALAPLTVPLISRIDANSFLSGTLILLWAFVETSVAFAILLIGFWLWRRSVTRGLVRTAEKRERQQHRQFLEDFALDMPVTVRWIVLAVIVFLFFLSLRGLWTMRDEVSLASLERMSPFGGLSTAMPLLGLFFYGWLLLQAARLWRRTRD